MSNDKSIERLAFSVQEVAVAIGVSSRTVHDLVRNGSIEHFRVGQRVLIPAEVLRRFIEQRTQSRKTEVQS